MHLEVEGVECGYGNGLVLQGVSFRVARGCFAAVLGPNGSGKTTLLRVISRILPPRAGRVRLAGRDLAVMARGELARHVAMVGPDWYPHFDFNVAQVVGLGRIPHLGPWTGEREVDREAVARALELTGTASLAARLLGSLSEGEKQRVMIARALAQEPSLLLLDEPTSHLDIAQQVEVLALLAHLSRERCMTVLAVMHDLNLAAAWCDYLLLLHQGRIFARGAPEEVLTRDNVELVYGAQVIVSRHPACDSPYVVPTFPARNRARALGSAAGSSRSGGANR